MMLLAESRHKDCECGHCECRHISVNGRCADCLISRNFAFCKRFVERRVD